MDLGLAGRVAVITGGSRGIGRAAALAFAAEGARVAITYRSERRLAEGVIEAILGRGGEAVALEADLVCPETVHAAVGAVLERWGRLDVLVNNAVMYGEDAAWEPVHFDRLNADAWQRELRANAEGPMAAIQAALPAMRAQGWGRIVNVSSTVAEDGQPGRAAYAAAKGALHGLTKTLHKELGAAGTLINVVMPGPTLTERLSSMLPPAVRAEWERASPIGRLLVPEEVVPTIVFLGSAANMAVTGEIIRVSGGRP